MSHQRGRISKRAACAAGPAIHLIRGGWYRSVGFSLAKMDQVVNRRPEQPEHPGSPLIIGTRFGAPAGSRCGSMRITRGNDSVAAAAFVVGSYPGRRITFLAPGRLIVVLGRHAGRSRGATALRLLSDRSDGELRFSASGGLHTVACSHLASSASPPRRGF